jgi:DNA polymerase III alpha subunit (gram-positive type)
MAFHKDILVIDFEGMENPTQIGAVLLDKQTLEEKDSFVSYIQADLNGKVSHISGITQAILDNAPSQKDVGLQLHEKFGTDVFLAAFVQDFDIRHLRTLIEAAGLDFTRYDYHFLDLWSLAYVHALKNGFTGGFRSEELFQYYGGKPRGLHDALEDCRLAAHVLRKIY